jgi:hypothetical protein
MAQAFTVALETGREHLETVRAPKPVDRARGHGRAILG